MDGWAGQAYRMPAGCKDLISIPAGEPARKRRSLTLKIAPRQGASEISKKRGSSAGRGAFAPVGMANTSDAAGGAGVGGSAAAASVSGGHISGGDGRHVRHFRHGRAFGSYGYYDDTYAYGGCGYYYRRAVATGSSYW